MFGRKRRTIALRYSGEDYTNPALGPFYGGQTRTIHDRHDPLCWRAEYAARWGQEPLIGYCDCHQIALARAGGLKRLRIAAAEVTFTETPDGGLHVAIDDPNNAAWTPLALDLIPDLVRNASVAQRLADAEKVAALFVDVICEQDAVRAHLVAERDAALRAVDDLAHQIETLAQALSQNDR